MFTINPDIKLPYLVKKISFSNPTSGKMIHIVEIYDDETLHPICGSGTNSAGATWRKPSRFSVSNNQAVEKLCTKCAKSKNVFGLPYVKVGA
jgi:hypothetical protein